MCVCVCVCACACACASACACACACAWACVGVRVRERERACACRGSSTIPHSCRDTFIFLGFHPAVTLSKNKRIFLCNYYVQLPQRTSFRGQDVARRCHDCQCYVAISRFVFQEACKRSTVAPNTKA